jgi:uncharacterized membrane protein
MVNEPLMNVSFSLARLGDGVHRSRWISINSRPQASLHTSQWASGLQVVRCDFVDEKVETVTTRSDRAALSLAALLALTTTAHLVRPHTFDEAVPDWLPGRKVDWEIGSGFAELGCAALLAYPRTRRLGGYAAAALFVAVFPGNVAMVAKARTPRARLATLLRLPMQIPLVWWAWRVARPAA